MPIKFKALTDGDLEIELYDVIGFWGTSAKDFAAKIKQAKGKTITLRINSPGGSVIDGTVMYNLLVNHEGDVIAIIDGMAASMAGVIACAADQIIMPANTFFMIHKPSVDLGGNTDDMRKHIEVLEKMEKNLIDAYIRKTGKSRNEVEKWFEGGDNWFDAQECFEMGIADEVTDEVEAAALVQFSGYFPQRQFAAQAAPIPPVIPTGGQQEQPKSKMNRIIALLGLAATAAEDAIVSAVQSLQNRVATLEREKTETAEAHAKVVKGLKDAALQEATNAVNTAEANRKKGIKDLTDKYNQAGDLNDATVVALSGDTTPEVFKDIVLDIVSKRSTKQPLRPSDLGSGDDEVSAFVKKYKAADVVGRRRLVRENKALARQATRELQLSASE